MTDSADSKAMSFLGHLEELRTALIWIGAGLTILFVPAMLASDWLLAGLIKIGAPGMKLQYFSPLEPFIVQLKIAFFAALLTGSPLVFWRLWKFVSPGLYQKERHLILRLTFVTTSLFLIGAVLALLLVVPLMMKFSLSFQTDQLVQLIGLQQFVSMSGWLMIGFGVMFQFPVATYLLVTSGLVSAATLRKQRPIVVVVILILAALLTPPDVLSQLILGIPAWAMFEISLLLAVATVRRRGTPAVEEDSTATPVTTSWFDIGPEDDYRYENVTREPEPTGTNRYQRPYDRSQNRRRIRSIGNRGRTKRP